MEKKKIRMAVALLLATALFMAALPAQAGRPVPDRKIVGVWMMQSMQYDGEKKVMLPKNYTRVKCFGRTGEYACAEVTRNDKGQYVIVPHEYGKYSYTRDQYTEMGRKTVWVMKNATTAECLWSNCHETWQKVTIPDKLRQEIVLRCKAIQTPSAKTQAMIRKYLLNK